MEDVSFKKWPVVSKVVCSFGGLVMVAPNLAVLCLNRMNARIPPHVGFLTLVLVSVCGFGIGILGLIPALFAHSRSQ